MRIFLSFWFFLHFSLFLGFHRYSGIPNIPKLGFFIWVFWTKKSQKSRDSEYGIPQKSQLKATSAYSSPYYSSIVDDDWAQRGPLSGFVGRASLRAARGAGRAGQRRQPLLRRRLSLQPLLTPPHPPNLLKLRVQTSQPYNFGDFAPALRYKKANLTKHLKIIHSEKYDIIILLKVKL